MNAPSEVYYDWLARHSRLTAEEQEHECGWKVFLHLDDGAFGNSAHIVDTCSYFYSQSDAQRFVDATRRSKKWRTARSAAGDARALLVVFKRAAECWVPVGGEPKEPTA